MRNTAIFAIAGQPSVHMFQTRPTSVLIPIPRWSWRPNGLLGS